MGERPPPAPAALQRRPQAVAFALLAAFLWASYYLFILELKGTISFSALMAWPFLVGGVAYGIWAYARGELPRLIGAFGEAWTWIRVLLFYATQALVLGIALSGGPIDSALLSLVGDVILTPLLARAVVGEGRGLLASPGFLLGMGLSASGASLTILQGGSAEPLAGFLVLGALALPFILAVYFVSAAGANRDHPISSVAGGAALGAAGVSFLLAPLSPGGWAGLWIGPTPLLLLGICGVVTFLIGPELYFRAIRKAGLTLPALLMAAIPVFTLGFTVLATGTYPAPLGLLGIPVAALGAWFAVRATGD
ncbi:MAG TPA: DMT family transporter, partial [Thermoplasmata archaeon]|nr:DMT family transporter [Thermoplasmata archaeon]